MNEKKLMRSTTNKMIAGVCGGLAAYLNLDPTLVRVAFALLTVFTGGTGALVYIVLWFVMPEDTAGVAGGGGAGAE